MPKVIAQGINESIQMLKANIDENEIVPLLSALEALEKEPDNDACFEQFLTAFGELGIKQGAVLTYAPYLMALVSDDPFGMLDY